MKTKLVVILMFGASSQAWGMEKEPSTPPSLTSSCVAQEGAYINLPDVRSLQTVVVALFSRDPQPMNSSCIALEGACAQALMRGKTENVMQAVLDEKNFDSMTDSELIKLRLAIQEACKTVPLTPLAQQPVEMQKQVKDSDFDDEHGVLIGRGLFMRTLQSSQSGFVDVTYEAENGEIEMKVLSK
jgi:hypothetical protein